MIDRHQVIAENKEDRETANTVEGKIMTWSNVFGRVKRRRPAIHKGIIMHV